MKKILLEVIGTQRIDAEKDKIELTTIGSLREEENAFIITYFEEQEEPQKPIKVSVRIAKDESRVEMNRSGAFDGSLIIEKSKRNLCHYGTQIGDVIMGIYGRNIEIEMDNEKGKFSFDYDIDVNGAVTSSNAVIMNFTKNQE